MTLASVHIPLWASAPPAVALAAVLTWYWIRLGRSDVPLSRRRIRRVSLAVIFVSLPVFVTALSVIDWQVRRSAYVILWSVALLCLLLIMITAIVDAMNNVRLHRRRQQDELLAAAALIVKGANQQRQAAEREQAIRSSDAMQHDGHHVRNGLRHDDAEPPS